MTNMNELFRRAWVCTTGRKNRVKQIFTKKKFCQIAEAASESFQGFSTG
jgi:hypothetical protein